jgi:hypothetical protein
MPDPVVDRLEVVEVEDDEREVPVVAMRAGDLPGKRLVEVAPVVEARQRVEVRELARLPEAVGILDRGPGPRCELFERLHLFLAEGLIGRACEDRHQPERRRLARERHRDSGSDRIAVGGDLIGAVVVRHRDRASLAPVGRAGHRLVLRLVGREAEGGDDRLGSGLRSERDERRVHSVDRAGGIEHAREHLVEVDRAGELSEQSGALAFELGLLEGARQLADHVVHARLEVVHDLGEPLVGLRRAPHDPLEEQRHDQRCQRRADRREGDGHRLSLTLNSSPSGFPSAANPGAGRASSHCNRLSTLEHRERK